MSLLDHLASRNCFPEKLGYPVALDEDNQVVTFYFFNLSGQFTGYQQYRPNASKAKSNDEAKGRYYTYATEPHQALWGLETLKRFDSFPFVVITEGIFSACRWHNYGVPAVATFTNNPKRLKNQLQLLDNRPTLAACDGPVNGVDAGRQLAKYADMALFCPPEKDCGDLTTKEFEDMLAESKRLFMKSF